MIEEPLELGNPDDLKNVHVSFHCMGCKALESKLTALKAELAQVTAENEKWQQQEDKLLNIIDTLTKKSNDVLFENTRYLAENARYREALERLHQMELHTHHHLGTPCNPKCADGIIDLALNPSPGETIAKGEIFNHRDGMSELDKFRKSQGEGEKEIRYSGQCRHRIPFGQHCKECER